MGGSKSFYFRESIDSLVKARWVAPYLLVPPMLAFMVFAESYLSRHGVTGDFTLGQRTVLAIWNASILLTLIAGVKSCLFFSNLWGSRWFRNSLALPVSRASGYWGPFLAVLCISVSMFILATGAVMLALPDVGRFPWIQVLAGSCAPVIWAVSMGALLGMLTTGAAASILFTTIMLVGFLAGIVVNPLMPGWVLYVLPPVGRIMTLSLVFPQGLQQAVLLLVHSFIALLAGRFLYGMGISRR